MRMAKLRRRYERQLEGARDVWRGDQALLRAAEADRAVTAEAVRTVRDSHKAIERQDPYGRQGALRSICTYCVTNPHPCPTWKSLNALLERLLGRAV